MTATKTPQALLIAVLGIGVIAGAGATYLVLTPRSASAPPATVATAAATSLPTLSTNAADTNTGEVSIRLSREEVARAGITLTPVEAATLGTAITIPAVVEPNTYQQTVVTALVSGRVTRVLVELGQQVRRGEVLAEVYSPELAEAQRAYISAAAELHAHEQQLARLEGLVALGSASRQELERAHAEHVALTTGLEGSRTRLALIGLATEQVAGLSAASPITATTEIRAPLTGVVTLRQANVGLNVDGTMPLFTVADLSTVWAVGNLNEQDVPRVSVGRPATIAISAFPDLALRSTISYIDPQLGRETRTAKVRAEVQNGHGQLRLGMYAQMRIDTAGDRMTPVIPKSAIQTIGDRTVVYVVDPETPGRFNERVIRTGVASGDRIAVEFGVSVGESVVSGGSFFLRAQRERLGPAAETPPTGARIEQSAGHARQTVRITVSDTGFEPDRLTLTAGVPAWITFVRTTDATCAKEVVFPPLNMRRELPLNTPVVIEFTPSHADLGFVCGVNMFRGTIAAQLGPGNE